jgi:hypothetical protein
LWRPFYPTYAAVISAYARTAPLPAALVLAFARTTSRWRRLLAVLRWLDSRALLDGDDVEGRHDAHKAPGLRENDGGKNMGSAVRYVRCGNVLSRGHSTNNEEGK